MRVTARSWCRVDLAGGTLDIWPLGLLHRGARTINVAIDLAVTVSVAASRDGRYHVHQDGVGIAADSASELAAAEGAELLGLIAEALALPPVALTVDSDSPRGAGLGASSALAMAAIAAAEAWTGAAESPVDRRAALARDLEARLMGLPTGRQDHFPAALGGVLEIRHRPGGESWRRLQVDLDVLGDCLLVAYSGRSHFSASTNWQIIRRRLEAEADTVARFEAITAVAARLPERLEAGDFAAVGRLVGEEWQQRRHLAEGVSTPEVERLLAAARDAGAWGGKACGAGGGGCVAVLAPAASRQAVAAALTSAGGRVLAARPAAAPVLLERRSD